MVTVLAKKLNESGWIDDIHHRSKGMRLDPSCVTDFSLDTTDITEAARAAEPKRTVQDLVDELRPDLQCKSSCFTCRGHSIIYNSASVSNNVKQEMNTLIRQYLETQIEK